MGPCRSVETEVVLFTFLLGLVLVSRAISGNAACCGTIASRDLKLPILCVSRALGGLGPREICKSTRNHLLWGILKVMKCTLGIMAYGT